MKELESLLKKYAEGTITQEEQSQLEQLTHRDRVVSAAGQQAVAIHRRRVVRIGTVASIAVVLAVGATFLFRPNVQEAKNEAVLVAETDVQSVQPTATPSVQEEVQTPVSRPQQPVLITTDVAEVTPAEQQVMVEKVVSAELQDEVMPAVVISSDPVVACNTQCSPDSVINDIWKFLKV